MIEIIGVGMYVFFEALSVVYCLHYLYGEKTNFDLISICFIILDVIWMEIVRNFQLNAWWSLVIYPIIIVYCLIKFGFHFKALLINNILCMMIFSSLQASIMIIFSLILGKESMYTFDTLLINVLAFGIVKQVLSKCKLKKISDALQENENIIRISLSVAVICILVFVIGYKQKGSFEILYYCVLGVCIALMIFAIIDIGRHKIKTREVEAELRLHKIYESSFRGLIDEICARQHEFDNHINAIYSQHRMYKSYKTLVEAQQKYCDEIIDENQYNKILSNGNPVILCFLYSKFMEMKKEGVTVTYKINIGNLDCKMPIYKMVELLGNLISNAVEAVWEKEEKKIYILMTEEKSSIVIQVSNKSDVIEDNVISKFFKKGYSQKGRRRGYGLYNVARICEEYNAAVICKNEKKDDGNWLNFRIIINKPL